MNPRELPEKRRIDLRHSHSQIGSFTPHQKEMWDKYMSWLGQKYDIPKDLFAGDTPDEPSHTDIWAGPKGELESDSKRLGSSFGDEAGIADKLKSLGFKDARKNAHGDMVVQGEDGRWYADLPGSQAVAKVPLLGTEIPFPTSLSEAARAVENYGGHALKDIGMLAGAGAGEGVMSVPLSGAGSTIGEYLRSTIGRGLGTYKGGIQEQGLDAVRAATEGMMAELGVKGIQKIPGVGKAVDWMGKTALTGGRKITAGAAHVLTGVPYESAERLIQYPWRVTNPPSNYGLGGIIKDELKRRLPFWQGDFKTGFRDALVRNRGKTVNTEAAIAARRLGYETPLDEFGDGLLPQTERDTIEEYIKSRLTTPKEAETVLPGADSARRQPSEPVDVVPGQYSPEFTPVETVPVEDGMDWNYKPTFRPKIVPTRGFEKNAKIPTAVSNPAKEIVPPIQMSPWVGPFTNQMPERPFEQLIPSIQSAGAGIGEGFDKVLPNRTPLYDAGEKLMVGRAKGEAHLMDPAYGAVDEAYSRHLDHTKLLKSSLTDSSKEGAAGSLVSGVNKTEQRAALKAEAPDAWAGPVGDRAAYEDFAGGSGLKGWLPPMRSVVPSLLAGEGLRNAAGGGVGGLAGATAAALTLTSPRAWYYGLGTGSKMISPWTKAIEQNGSRMVAPLIRGMSDSLIQTKGRGSPWHLLPEDKP